MSILIRQSRRRVSFLVVQVLLLLLLLLLSHSSQSVFVFVLAFVPSSSLSSISISIHSHLRDEVYERHRSWRGHNRGHGYGYHRRISQHMDMNMNMDGNGNGNRNRNSSGDEHPERGQQQQQQQQFILPIFPLRKRVKFPTQSLQLTLWEERYKALSREVLQPSSSGNNNNNNNDPKLFGALYCSHKTQIVTGGINPITPLVEVGDVGVVCTVLNSQVFGLDGKEVVVEDGEEERFWKDVVVDNNDDDGNGNASVNVQKIRINGLAVGRFRVEEILSTGYDISNGRRRRQGGGSGSGSLDDDDDDDVSSLPFIMVRGSRIDDEEIFQTGEQECKCNLDQILDLQHRVLQQRGGSLMNGNDGGLTTLTPEQLHAEDYAWSFNAVGGSGGRGGEGGGGVGGDNKECQTKRQLLSFAITSQFESGASSSEMLKMLQCTSTNERIAYIEEKLLPKSNGIFSMLANFINP